MRRIAFLLALCVIACGKGELASPCEEDKDCERALECVGVTLRPGILGLQCTQYCASDAECESGKCFDGTFCARPCEDTAADCPEGTVCADSFCVLPCNVDSDCMGTGLPYCPAAGSVCSAAQ